MRFILATFTVTLAIFAAAASQPAEQGSGIAIQIYNRESAFLNADGSVNVHAVNSHLASLDAKNVLGFENYERNTGVKHPCAVKSLGKRSDDIPLITESGFLFYGTISVGTPAEDFTVAFDTGYADFFLPGPTCDTCTGHKLWNPAFSSTAVFKRFLFPHEFVGVGRVLGDLYTDTVSLADFGVKNQYIGVVTTYPPQLQRGEFAADGLMGFAFPIMSTSQIGSPVFLTLFDAQPYLDQVFSFKLSSPGAELYIGGSNSTLYVGSFTYVPVLVAAYWMVSLDSYQGNGWTFPAMIPAIIDTGAFIISGIYEQVVELHIFLSGTPIYDGPDQKRIICFAFPCNAFPTISLTFGGTSFSIPPSALNIGPALPDSPWCISGLYPHTGDQMFWTIGQVFLKNVYTTFDYHNLRVGFAQLAP